MAKPLRIFSWVVALVGCSHPLPSDSTPEGAVKTFVRVSAHAFADSHASRTTYELLAEPARENLALRAKRYAAATGKGVAPERMLAMTKLELRFEPETYKARIDSDRASVEVRGIRQGETATVPCVHEKNGWRLDVKLPGLLPMERQERD